MNQERKMSEGRAARAAGNMMPGSRAPKRAWARPAMRRLQAGAAENAGAVSDDGVIGNS
jgi:hypothetical protein